MSALLLTVGVVALGYWAGWLHGKATERAERARRERGFADPPPRP